MKAASVLNLFIRLNLVSFNETAWLVALIKSSQYDQSQIFFPHENALKDTVISAKNIDLIILCDEV